MEKQSASWAAVSAFVRWRQRRWEHVGRKPRVVRGEEGILEGEGACQVGPPSSALWFRDMDLYQPHWKASSVLTGRAE